MGKKVKKKAGRNAQKEKQKIPTIDLVVKEERVCPHIETGINLDKVSSKITSLESLKCDDCREGVVDRRASKVKGRNGKKKGGGSSSESKSIWVCLECGQFTCGGIGFPTTPQSHATRHAKQYHHPLAIQLANPNLRWCFSCNTLIPIQTSEENGEQKNAFSSVVKVLKTRPSSENSLDVEDVWFGSGSVTEVKSVNTQISSENSGGYGYTVKGLVNLGNTCFFNSILQNLLAMDTLRDYFLKLEQPIGPLSVSLKKLFVQTNPSTIDKNIINPRSLFNSICTMAPQFKGYQQQDSHELLRFLLDGLCNEKCSPSSQKDDTFPKDNPTFVDATFGGQTCSSVSCLECGHSSIVYEPYLDLSLPLPTKKSPSKKIPPKKQKPPPKRHEKVSKNINEKFSGITIKESGNPVSNSNGNDNSSWLDYLGSEEPPPLEDDSWLDYLEPCSSSNHHDMSSQNGDTSAFQDSGNGNELFWGDEPQARVQESEILLLPYKELTSTTNGNDMTQESSDFDGFGGLFDEPEVVSGPTARNNSGSDSDEVDDSDWPVSVDKCLSYFTTSEILTKSDHAWQCEQCSKVFLEQKMRLKNKLQEKSVSNGVSGNGMCDSGVVNSVSNGFKNGNKSDCCLGNGGSPELSPSSRVLNGEHDLNGVDDEVDSGSVKVTRDASKRILISKVPPILTIHLKRLSQDSRGRLSKLNGHVDFEEIIDLKPYMDPRCKDKGTCKYRLMGVVEHSGTARGGHYVAYVRGGLNSWYHASDAHVREVSFEEVLRCEAYILFYQQI